MRANYVITIARDFGAGGRTIGLKLSEMLDIPCYERQILAMASERSGIDEDLFVDADERLNGTLLSRKLRHMPFSTVLEPWEREFTSDTNLFNIQAEIIRTLARRESFIVVGKCADFVLTPYGNVVRTFIEAPKHACIRTIMDRTNVSAQRAEQMYKKTNQYRAEYYHYYSCGGDWHNPMNYDMVLNSYKLGTDACANIIANHVQFRFGDKKG